MRRCSAEGCEKPHLARGFCNKHYLRWRTAGGQTTPRPPLWTPEEDVALLAIELTPHTERYQGRGAFAVIADRLGRTVQACTDRYRRLMRDGGHVPGQQWTEEGLWTPEEDAVIERVIRDHPERAPFGRWPDVAGVLGRTLGAVRLRAWKHRRGLVARGRPNPLIFRGLPRRGWRWWLWDGKPYPRPRRADDAGGGVIGPFFGACLVVRP